MYIYLPFMFHSFIETLLCFNFIEALFIYWRNDCIYLFIEINTVLFNELLVQ